MNIGILYAYVAFVCSIVIIVIKNRISALSGNTTFQKPFSKLLNFFIIFTVIDGIWGIFFSNAIIKSYYCLEFFTYGFHFCAALSAFMWAGYMSDFLKVSPHVKKIINYTRCIIFTIQLYILISNLFTHYAFNITRDCSYLPTPYRNISFYVQFSYYAFILIFTLINLHLQKNNNEKKVMYRTALFFSTVPLIFGFGQMLFSDAPFYSMGFMLVSVAIYGFNVTAEREKVIHQLHQKEQNKLGSIVEALSSNYQAIYYVDLETNTYQSIISDPRFADKVTSKMDTSNPDFFETLVKNASKVLYPDDKNYVLTKLTKENLLHELETNTSFTITYRISIDKIPIYYQMKCVFSTIPNETKKVIIGVYDIDNQVHEQQQTSEIISAVGEAFESIYLVNTLNDTFEIFRRSEYLANYYNDENIPYSVAINQYIDKDVHPNYREVLRKYTNLKFIKDKLKDKKTIDISFYDIHTGEDLYYEMRIVKPQKYEANGKIIIGFINRNEVILQHQREVFITGLADDYDSVYYGNILDDSFENIRSTIEFRKNHPQYKEHMTYTDFLEAAKNFIHPDDLAPFMIEMSKENIAFKLNQDKSFYISYRQVINHTIRYYRIKIIRTENWEKKKEFMLGTSNVDELIRSRIAFQEEDARKTSVLQSMANSYVSICYIDTETQEYIPYFGTTEIQKWYSASKYTEAFENYVNNSVLPEYRFQLLAAVSPDNLQRNTENKNSSDNNILTIPFQDNHTGTPLYYELALIRVDSTHIISSIQNRDYIIRKENEQRRTLADAKDKAEAASRAKSTFLFNMSHDIRTPMNAIKGFIELAERNINSKTKISDYLSKIKTSSDHLLHLINDVLDMSRIESGKVTIDEAPTNIKTETENLISIVNVSAIEKDIELTYDISKLKDYYIYSDQLHVTQILLNVLTNAIKYTKAGGKVHYSIEQTDDSTNTVAAYKITVQDNGIGMSPDFVSQIFEEFARASNTTKSKVEGTGLGMSIVKRLVDMMGGQIDIDSELGKGTTVTIHLNFRICDSVSTENTEISEQSENTFLKGKRLLLVEDNDFNREIAREILEDEGLLIEEAEDGTIAVEKVQNHPANYYDIVLMDIQMPYMDGYTATKTIRNLNNDDYSKLPIIAMTANAFEEDIQNAIDAGMNGHLSKPIEIPRLLDCLNKIASKGL